jgi:hypothetical protein
MYTYTYTYLQAASEQRDAAEQAKKEIGEALRRTEIQLNEIKVGLTAGTQIKVSIEQN